MVKEICHGKCVNPLCSHWDIVRGCCDEGCINVSTLSPDILLGDEEIRSVICASCVSVEKAKYDEDCQFCLKYVKAVAQAQLDKLQPILIENKVLKDKVEELESKLQSRDAGKALEEWEQKNFIYTQEGVDKAVTEARKQERERIENELTNLKYEYCGVKGLEKAQGFELALIAFKKIVNGQALEGE